MVEIREDSSILLLTFGALYLQQQCHRIYQHMLAVLFGTTESADKKIIIMTHSTVNVPTISSVSLSIRQICWLHDHTLVFCGNVHQ